MYCRYQPPGVPDIPTPCICPCLRVSDIECPSHWIHPQGRSILEQRLVRPSNRPPCSARTWDKGSSCTSSIGHMATRDVYNSKTCNWSSWGNTELCHFLITQANPKAEDIELLPKLVRHFPQPRTKPWFSLVLVDACLKPELISSPLARPRATTTWRQAMFVERRPSLQTVSQSLP